MLAAAIGAGGMAARPARAASMPGCDSMLLPAVQLKHVGRGFSRWHSGIDLMAPWGSPARAAAGGTIVYQGWYYGYGKMIDISHGNGVVTRYGHLAAFMPGLHVGSTVAAGQQIGRVGNTGFAHGAHVHFEVRIGGHPVNPAPYLAMAACPAGMPAGPRVEEAQAPAPLPLPPTPVPPPAVAVAQAPSH